ncbi:DinB family protein [Nocardia sp. BSTN01]|uniref:DinB family protein n=1 Tax=Nocardia sp. BSTN01 TaxID=2783665 RepID=UPI00188E7E19|nr:DinB family protein [Nocardia sp. BSTN01]MBF5001669.1 DinB family protein [Nocardia sp. BSTN01]
MDRCAECGYQYRPDEAPRAATTILAGVAELAATLNDCPDARRRRLPELWSPLEYGCHVRDVLLVQRERVLLARRTDRPALVTMGRDERADHDGYAEQGPADVAQELLVSARLLANVLDRLDAHDWNRRVLYNYPDRVERELRWVAVHTIHEVRHHLLDVRRQLVDED